jgi:hypothetical protein
MTDSALHISEKPIVKIKKSKDKFFFMLFVNEVNRDIFTLAGFVALVECAGLHLLPLSCISSPTPYIAEESGFLRQ